MSDTTPRGGTDTLEHVDTETTDPGDHDKFSHYVDRTKQADALILGTPIKALCGKVWVPSEIDNPVEKRTVCPECKEVYEGLPDV